MSDKIGSTGTMPSFVKRIVLGSIKKKNKTKQRSAKSNDLFCPHIKLSLVIDEWNLDWLERS